MEKQVRKANCVNVGLLYFIALNEVGEQERDIAIPTQAVKGSIQGYEDINPKWGNLLINDVVALESFATLSNIRPDISLIELGNVFGQLARNGHICYKDDGAHRSIYLASTNQIAKIKDFTDCKIPIVHIDTTVTGNITSLVAHAGYISLKPTGLKLHFQYELDGAQALHKLLRTGGVFQIMR